MATSTFDIMKSNQTVGRAEALRRTMLAYLDELQDLQARALAGCASLAVSDGGRGLFDVLDTDHDGRLSVREMRNAIGAAERDYGLAQNGGVTARVHRAAERLLPSSWEG